MINVVIARDLTGSIGSLEINGHSGYSEKGHDIICSAVSAIAYTAAGALEDLAGLKGCYEEGDGHMVISLPRDMEEQQRATAGIIMETAAIGFKQIGLSYGKYVSILEREV